MKRALHILPLIGLGLILLALLFRGLREEGLALRDFPAPPNVLLGAYEITPPDARIEGVVQDAGGAAISEALVLVDLDGELAWTYSDAQGRFTLLHLPAGPLELELLARKFRTERFDVNAPSSDLQLVMDEPVAEIPELVELVRSDLTGRVVSSIGGRGLLGYEVVLLPATAPHEFGQPVPVRVEVGADRGFRFEGLIQGEYRVLVLPPWARGGSWPNLCDTTRRSYVHGPASAELELPIAAGEVQGRVLDSHGSALQGALILLTPEAAPERPWPVVSSDSQGSFQVRDLPPGSYEVELRAGEARWRETLKVLAGHTSVIDLPPLEIHRRER